MKKWLKTTIILVVITVLIVGGVVISNIVKARNEIKVKYDVTPALATVGVNDMGLYISASGNLQNADDVNINTQAYGRVLSVDVEAGQSVTEGEVLATLDDETLQDDITTLEESIFNKELEISTGVFRDDTYYIKSPIAGEVKDIKVEEDDTDTDVNEASDIADVMNEYGYLALISSDDMMYIVTEDTADFLKVGNEVTVRRYGYDYDAVVERKEDGKTYVLVENDNITLSSKVSIYKDAYEDRITGIAELYDWVVVIPPIAEGSVSRVEVTNNESVEVGDVLFKVKTRSQRMVNLYNQLDDLKADLKEKQMMLEHTQITAPVDGIIKSIAISEEQDVAYEMSAFMLADTETWLLPVAIDELDINKITEGMIAVVTVDAYEDEMFSGEVVGISSVGVAQGGVTSYTVLIEVQNNDIFKLNMTANVEIEAQFISSALTVPADAIREMNGKTFVVVYTNPTEAQVNETKQKLIQAASMTTADMDMATVDFKNISQEDMAKLKAEFNKDGGAKGDRQALDGNRQAIANRSMVELSITDQLYGRLVPVEVGLINETYAQIISGLNEGDQVILQSTTSVEETTSFGAMRIPGMGGGK
ncbi:MAG: biotin/lipoyl-binding protein [Clostridiales bacterium]|nr:biotin/lipoyl-binding protein [Clostridiales bacterium]